MQFALPVSIQTRMREPEDGSFSETLGVKTGRENLAPLGSAIRWIEATELSRPLTSLSIAGK